jgi:fatty acid-binding protein DegV
VELVEERVNGRRPLRLASLHANAAESAQGLLDNLNGRLEIDEVIVSTVSPVVGTHVGPWDCGFGFYGRHVRFLQ